MRFAQARPSSCRAVERAKIITAMLLARPQQQPRQLHPQEAELVGPTTRRGAPSTSTRREMIAIDGPSKFDRFGAIFHRFFKENGLGGLKFFLACGALRGPPAGVATPVGQNRDPPPSEHPRHLAGGGRHPGGQRSTVSTCDRQEK